VRNHHRHGSEEAQCVEPGKVGFGHWLREVNGLGRTYQSILRFALRYCPT
jgi:hypothetical protein